MQALAGRRRGDGLAATAPGTAAPRSRAYLAGVCGGQLANNALNVTLPLLLLQLSHSIGLIAFVTAIGQGLDAAGTLLGGWLGGRLGARASLILATGVRCLALAVLPLLLGAARLGVPLAVGIYLVDSLARGVTDTARATVPLLLAGQDRTALARLNARYQTCFEAGNLAGPFVVAGLLFALGTVSANWLAPAAFAVTTILYLGIPGGATPRPVGQLTPSRLAQGRGAGAVRVLLTDRRVALFFISVVVLTLYPVKALLPVLFAGDVLKSPQSAAWLAGCFGAGGVLGSLLYQRLHRRVLVSTWLQWSAVGVGVYSTIFISANFYTMAAGILLFATTNVLARLATNSSLQAHLPADADAGVMGLSRFAVNVLSMLLRLIVGLAFTFAVTPKQGFSTVGIVLFAFALAQFVLSRRVADRAYDEVAADEAASPTLFDKDPAVDAPALQRRYRKRKSGRHFYFRTMLFPMQDRFGQLLDQGRMARVFLHGSPHVHNYARTARGAAMVDFDRSRHGPYGWDVVRFLTSLALYRAKADHEFLAPAVLERFAEGYRRGLRQPELGFEAPAGWGEDGEAAGAPSVAAYLAANRGRAAEMRRRPLPADDPRLLAILRGYLTSRGELALLDAYRIEEAGAADGSWGCEHLLVVLAPREETAGAERIMLDLKRARADADTPWYRNPFDHQGKRMIAAAELYAPGWEARQGYTTFEGHDYWGHALPVDQEKLARPLKRKDQGALAFAVGTQLGRAHGLSVQDATPVELEEQFTRQFPAIVAAGRVIAGELAAAHARYLARLEQGRSDEATLPERAAPTERAPASASFAGLALRCLAIVPALLLTLFLTLPLHFADPGLVRWDRAVAYWFHGLFGGASPGRDLFFRVTLQLGAIEFVYAGCALIGLWLWRKGADAIYHVSLLLLVAGSARLVSVELKTWIGRAHAHFWSAHVMLKNAFLDPGNEATKGFSYPSTQALIAACFFGCLIWLGWRQLPRRIPLRLAWTAAMLALVVLVGASTLDAGIYYPTDVVGGYALAGVWLFVWLAAPALLRGLLRRRAPVAAAAATVRAAAEPAG